MHRVSSTCAIAALTPVVLAGPLDPPPGPVSPTMKTLDQVESRIPITLETTPGDDDSYFKITEPGSHYVTGSLTVDEAKTIIEVSAGSVTIDLGGHVLDGDGSCGIKARGNTSYFVGNLSADDLSNGIEIEGTENVVVHNVAMGNLFDISYNDYDANLAGPHQSEGTVIDTANANWTDNGQ